MREYPLHILKQGIEEGVFPGCVLLVAHGERIAFWEWAGTLSYLPGTEMVMQDTIYDLASLTKPLATGLALMKLADEGKLELDQSLAELVPDAVPREKESITPRLLLCHSAGLKDYQTFYLELEKTEFGNRKSSLRERLLRTPLVYEPGRGVLYSDLGFMLLEWIIEEKTGVSLPAFLNRHFYGPMGLKRLFMMDHAAPPRYAADQYAATEECSWRKQVLQGRTHDENADVLGGCSGHAGLFGTAEEVYRVVGLLRDHFHERRRDCLKPETVRRFFTKQHIVRESTWALAWDTPSPEDSSAGRHFSRNSVGHLGFTGTSVWLDLEKDVIAVLLTNRVHPTRKNEKIKQFRPRIHDALMEELGLKM